MHWLGMPNALLWGVVAFVFNYVPYAGSAMTLILLTVVALVSFDGLEGLRRDGLYLVLATIEGQICSRCWSDVGLTSARCVVLLSLWFGGWLWGIAGVALAMPLLVTAKALAIELAQAGRDCTGTPDAAAIRARAGRAAHVPRVTAAPNR